MSRLATTARGLLFALACGAALPGAALADCPHVTGNASPVVGRSDLQYTLRQCANESGRLTEHRQMLACNALVRYGCTPSQGHIQTTEDRQILIWAYTVRASALLDLGHTDEALADLDDALSLDSNNTPLLVNRCRVRAAANRELDLALGDCNAAVQAADAELAIAHDNRGLVHLRRSEFMEALSDYDASLAIVSTSASALYGRAIAYSRLGHQTNAASDVIAAEARDEHMDEWYNAIGLTPQP
jgi:tetratricopeptide (TPR) repeat protein